MTDSVMPPVTDTIELLAREMDLSPAEFAARVTALRIDAAVERLLELGSPAYEDIAAAARDIGIPIEALRVLADTPGEATVWPAPIDLAALARAEPSVPRMIIDDWFPCGYATLLAGHGGVGKSGIALDLAVCAALGRPFFGLAVRQCHVLYLSCEDRTRVLHWRLDRICRRHAVGLDTLAGHLDIIDLVGRDTCLWERDPRTGQTLTEAYGQLRRRVQECRNELLMVDGISDTFGGNENARTEIKRFVNALVALVSEDNGAVLLIGHVNRLTASGTPTSEGYSGSTGWHNAVRARWYLYPETACGEDSERTERTGDLIMELQKSNLGRIDQSMRFRWDDSAHLFVGQEITGATKADRTHRDVVEREGILAAFRESREDGIPVPAAATGNRTAYHVLSARDEFPEGLKNKAGTRRFWRHIEVLRRIVVVREGSIRRANRHTLLTLELVDAAASKAASHASNDDSGIERTIDARRSAPMRRMAPGGYRGGARAQPGRPTDGNIAAIDTSRRGNGEVGEVGEVEGEITAASWMVSYPDGRRIQKNCTIPVTREHVLRKFPDATGAAPISTRDAFGARDLPGVPPQSAAIAKIHAWLASIGETDPETIAAILESCARDPNTMAAYRRSAGEEGA